MNSKPKIFLNFLCWLLLYFMVEHSTTTLVHTTLLQRGEQTRNSNTSKKIIFFSYDVRAPRYAQGTDTSTIPTSDE